MEFFPLSGFRSDDRQNCETLAGMTETTTQAKRRRNGGTSFLPGAVCVAASVIAIAALAGPVMADSKENPTATGDNHYQVYIGGRGETAYTVNREWGGLRMTTPSAGADVYAPSLTHPAGNSGITYFTPSLSGVRIGVGVAGAPSDEPQAAGKSQQYTDLGPRAAKGRDSAGNWQIGGTVGFSALELGANIGDHNDPSCSTGGNCKTNDFWDVGIALRIGSGAISAGYTASQPRGPRPDDVDRIDIFSLNAGYKVGPGLNIYGGVDWVDLQSTGETAETPLDTRFMLGTNLRF